MSANPQRGEIEVRAGGKTHIMKASFAALAKIQGDIGTYDMDEVMSGIVKSDMRVISSCQRRLLEGGGLVMTDDEYAGFSLDDPAEAIGKIMDTFFASGVFTRAATTEASSEPLEVAETKEGKPKKAV